MTPFWFIEACAFDDYSLMAYAAQELGCEVKIEKYVPFDGMDYSTLPQDRPVIFYGSLNVIRDFTKKQSIFPDERTVKPFAWCFWAKFRCQTYYTYYGEYLLQRKYGLYPIREIKRMRDQLFQLYGNHEGDFREGSVMYCRPDENDKVFTGGLVKYNSFDHWYKMTTDYGQPADMLCVVGAVEEPLHEYRLIIAEGKVIASSLYKLDFVLTEGQGCPQEAKDLAEKLYAIWHPHDILVMDIAETPHGYRLIEIGPINAAGLYDCDRRTVVKAMTDLAVKEFG